MAISLKQYDAMITRLDALAKSKPAQYRLRVALLAALGYAYILGMLVLGVALFVGTSLLTISGHFNSVFVRLDIIIVLIVSAIVKSLWVKFPTPEGIPVTRADCPVLYDILDRVATKLQVPKLHHVLITEDFNASLVQYPRLGIIGWPANYLVLGLPLMQALTAAQVESVVAHEFGHLSGNHGRFAAWIYRVRQTWKNLYQHLDKAKNRNNLLFGKFIEWYSPYLSAYSFVQSRMHEYIADQCSADVVGAQTAAQALIAIELKARLLARDYTPRLMRYAAETAEPPAGIIQLLHENLQSVIPRSTALQWLGDALGQPATNTDPHPSLKERIEALGYRDAAEQVQTMAINQTAADILLAPSLDRLATQLDERWRASVAQNWQKQHEKLASIQKSLDELNQAAESGPLSAADAAKRAMCVAELDSKEAALPYAREAVELDPANASMQFMIGSALLDMGDEAGEPYLLRAMELDEDAVLPGSDILQEFWLRRGREDLAERYQERLYSQHAKLVEAEAEREDFDPKSRLLPHGVDAEIVQKIVDMLQKEPGIVEAYFSRKPLKHYAEEKPFYVLQLVTKYSIFHGGSKEIKKRRELVRRLHPQLDIQGNGVLSLRAEPDRTAPIKKLAKSDPGALIYKRKK